MSADADFPTAQAAPIDAPQASQNIFLHPVVQGNGQGHFGNTQNIYNGPVCLSETHKQRNVSSEKQAALSLMSALAFDQIESRLATISLAHANTCQWLFEREEYRAWRDAESLREHHGFFWIKGKPGAGKSTLMKTLQQYEEANYKTNIVISFFFNARGDELERSMEGMYRSLLWQLLQKEKDLASHLLQRDTGLSRQTWHVGHLRNMFGTAVSLLGRKNKDISCYVDALDECDDAAAREMVESFESFGQTAVDSGTRFRVLLSSRRYPHITINKCLHLDLEGQAGHEADMAAYIGFHLKIENSTIATEIRHSIRTRASGVFLWVVLVTRLLNEYDARGKTHLLRRRLNTIPNGLSELFEELLCRGTHDLDSTLLTYRLILFAFRPLTREELYFAVLANSEEDDVHDWNTDEITVDVMDRFLLDSSKGLAEMTRGRHPRVQFVHESVREYLLSTGLTTLQLNSGEALTQTSHDALAKCCDQYLQKSKAALLPAATDGMKRHMSDELRDISALRKRVAAARPFLGYAVDGMLYHANLAHSLAHPQDDFVNTFPHTLWRRLYNLTCQYYTRRLLDASVRVYTFLSMGAYNLADIEIRKQPWQAKQVITGEFYSSLLGAAAAHGGLKTMELLLKHGANPHGRVKSTSQSDCLAFAIETKDAPMVRLLIDGGVNLSRDLHRSFGSRCYLDLALDLTDCDSDILRTILTHQPYSSPTYWPAILTRVLRDTRRRRDGEAEQILLAKLDLIYADLASSRSGCVPERYVHAFTAACLSGHVPLVREFLKCDGPTLKDLLPLAVEAAVSQGEADIVRMLIEHGFEVDLPLPISRDNALILAVREGQDESVKTLLEINADTGCQNDRGETALCLAAWYGHHSIVKMLLSSGADANLRAYFMGRYTTALHHASIRGRADITHTLLEHAHTDIDALDSNGNHALYLASQYGQVGCVQVFLENDVSLRHLAIAMERLPLVAEEVRSMLHCYAKGVLLFEDVDGRGGQNVTDD